MLLNEGEVIDNCSKSVGILSDETILANHPWVDDPQAEMERVKEQKKENIEEYGLAFQPATDKDNPDEDQDEGKEGAGDD